MGMEDHDWYREMHLKRLKKTHFFRENSTPKLVIVLFWVVALFLLFQVSKHLPAYVRSSPLSSISSPVAPVEFVAPLQQINQKPEIHQVEAPAMQPEPAQIIQKQLGSVTIYLCKAYSGGMFWSSAYCGTQQALIDRTATVPGNLPFDQQVEIAEQQRSAAKRLYEPAPKVVTSSGASCANLISERRSIDQITEKMIWVPIEKQNANYHRMNQIKAVMARLDCSY